MIYNLCYYGQSSERFRTVHENVGSNPANGSKRFTSGELFGTIWNYMVLGLCVQVNGSERFTGIPSNYLELYLCCLYNINILYHITII